MTDRETSEARRIKAERQRAWYAGLSPERRAKHLAKTAARRAEKRAAETPEQAAERKAKAHAANQRWREENPEAWAELQAKHNARRPARRTEWTPEQREADNAKRREAYAERHRGRAREYSRVKLYGLTVTDMAEMRERQGDACAICRGAFVREPHVDHDHATGRVRGLLCAACNLGLGKFRDSSDLLRAAIAYLGT